MEDPAVAKWRQRGRVYLWQYQENTRNYPGWHMTADPEPFRYLLVVLVAAATRLEAQCFICFHLHRLRANSSKEHGPGRC